MNAIERPRAQRHLRVLLADDNDLVRETLADVLSNAGIGVIQARNGVEGLAMWRSHNVDVVVIDLVMPEKDGLETILELRKDDAGCKIIAISGGGRAVKDDLLARARVAGADVALRKPFDPAQLVSQVWNLAAGNDAGGRTRDTAAQ